MMKLPIISLLTAATLGLLVHVKNSPSFTALISKENKYQEIFTSHDQLPQKLEDQIIIALILITPIGISLCLTQIYPLMEATVIKVNSTQSTTFEKPKK